MAQQTGGIRRICERLAIDMGRISREAACMRVAASHTRFACGARACLLEARELGSKHTLPEAPASLARSHRVHAKVAVSYDLDSLQSGLDVGE